MNKELKSHFLLNPEIHFLNHGSFGACPAPVYEVFQAWQRELEAQPVEFIGRRYHALMAEARQHLADYLNCAADELIYYPNPTTAISMVVRSLNLKSGDEILATDHEYGAMDRLWSFMEKETDIRYLNQPISVPVTTHAAFIEEFWQGVTEKTKVIFISQITSETALTFPVKEICVHAREAGIMTIVDGAHVPGQIPLDLADLGADIYTGALHKWVCAPKGTAFLYARRDIQKILKPLVVSWGYDAINPSASQFVDYHEYQGTRDPAAFLTVPAAIQYQQDHDWEAVRDWAYEQVKRVRREINALTGEAALCPEDGGWFRQMAAIRLPDLDEELLKTRLYDEFKIEIPVYRWQGDVFMRVSIQAYNTEEDIAALIKAIQILIPELRK